MPCPYWLHNFNDQLSVHHVTRRWYYGSGCACKARGGEGCWLVVVASNSALSWQVEQLKEELAQGEELKKRAAELQQEVFAVRRPREPA